MPALLFRHPNTNPIDDTPLSKEKSAQALAEDISQGKDDSVNSTTEEGGSTEEEGNWTYREGRSTRDSNPNPN